MKKDIDDIEFGKLLKENLPEAGEDPWFTKRVLNRLPEERHSYRLTEKMLYMFGVVLCVIFWIFFIKTSDFSVITVKDVMYICGMAVASMCVLGQSVRSFFAS